MSRSIKAWSAVIAGVLAGCGSSYEPLDSRPTNAAIQRPDSEATNEQGPVENDTPAIEETPIADAAPERADEPAGGPSVSVINVDGPQEDPGFAVDVLDCATDQGYEVNRRAGQVGGTELHVLTVYESRGDHAYGYHPTGEAQVEVTRSAPVILVLSSYEPTHWTVSGASAQIELVILNGYHAQTLTIADGITVIDRSGLEEGNTILSACSYGDDGDGCDTAALISGAEALAGEPVSSLIGCYHASSFTVGDAMAGEPVPAEPDEPDGLPADCSSNAHTPFELRTFDRPDDELSCDGDQYVSYLEGHGLYLGVQLCGEPTTYRLYLAAEAGGPFVPATDTAGHGQDQCELLNPSFTIPNDDDITSGGCWNCQTSQNLPIEGQAVFDRDGAGQCFVPVAVTGTWSYQTSRLSCGVSVP